MSAEQLLGELEPAGEVVIADLEAGVGTLTRLPKNGVDVIVVVTEPSLKSIQVAQKIIDIAAGAHPGVITLVTANKVASPADHATIEETLSQVDVVVPWDDAVAAADRHGAAPLDSAPGSPGVAAISRLADLLETELVAGATA